MSFAVTSLKTIFPSSIKPALLLFFPIDSATGSSGPAHQACEFGVPIVSALFPDFELMAANENMAIRFYKVGDAAELANQLLAILQSPELEHKWQKRTLRRALK